MLTITCYKISPRSAAYEGKLKKGGGSQANAKVQVSLLTWPALNGATARGFEGTIVCLEKGQDMAIEPNNYFTPLSIKGSKAPTASRWL
jgi:hypothetical protein